MLSEFLTIGEIIGVALVGFIFGIYSTKDDEWVYKGKG